MAGSSTQALQEQALKDYLNLNKIQDYELENKLENEFKKRLQILDTYHDFGKDDSLKLRVNKILGVNVNTKVNNNYYFEPEVTKILYNNPKKNKGETTKSIYEILGTYFFNDVNSSNEREVVIEQLAKTKLIDDEFCIDKDELFTDIQSLATKYDNKGSRRINGQCYKNDTKIEDGKPVITNNEDGLIIINKVELGNETITYYDNKGKDIEINIGELTVNPGVEKLKNLIRKIIETTDGVPIEPTAEVSIEDDINDNITKVFKLDYNEYKNKNNEEREEYIKYLFDFKRLGDLQLIKVAKKLNIPFITGDRLAAIIANSSYGLKSLFISTSKQGNYDYNIEIYNNNTCTKLEANDTLNHLIIQYLLPKHNKEINIRGIRQKDLEYLKKDIENQISQTGGNLEEEDKENKENKTEYALGLIKIIKDYLKNDKNIIGDNTVLLFQYMFLGHMYHLYDDEVIQEVRENYERLMNEYLNKIKAPKLTQSLVTKSSATPTPPTTAAREKEEQARQRARIEEEEKLKAEQARQRLAKRRRAASLTTESLVTQSLATDAMDNKNNTYDTASTPIPKLKKTGGSSKKKNKDSKSKSKSKSKPKESTKFITTLLRNLGLN